MTKILDIIKPDTVFSHILKYRGHVLDAKSQLRLLYLETRRNLALIDTMKNRENAEAIKIVLMNFETEQLMQFFQSGERNHRVYTKIKSIDNFVYASEDDDDDYSQSKSINFLSVVSFLYVRIAVLRTISNGKFTGKNFKKINYYKRFSNIMNAFVALAVCLEDQKAVREMK